MSRRKFGFITGVVPKPTDDTGMMNWKCVQAMLVQWILNTIDVSLRKTLPYFEEARPSWVVLQKRFDVGNGTRKQQIKEALADCKQSKTMSVAEYFGKLQPLWDELA
ncbi:hypothetical protein LIER_11187 [Lithospermum erythrorhizon]|uniref:Retrotransposon gag domain-containing protein n=1 Tax=Lithospermum erythrorhizon TaxID=34254 RepID=A0AAV3PPZ2_LITER